MTFHEEEADWAAEQFRARFEKIWFEYAATKAIADMRAWDRIRSELGRQGVCLARFPRLRPSALISSLYCAKYGEPVCLPYSRLVEVAHWIVDEHPKYLETFRHALLVFGRVEQIVAEDPERLWIEKAIRTRATLRETTQAPVPGALDDEHDGERLARILFPELNSTGG
jgi:hypothetical protein